MLHNRCNMYYNKYLQKRPGDISLYSMIKLYSNSLDFNICPAHAETYFDIAMYNTWHI